jgi:hypothetical protein
MMDTSPKSPPGKRRTWIVILIYLSAIYLTLPVMRPLLQLLYGSVGRGTMGVMVNTVMSITAATVLYVSIKKGHVRFALIALPLGALAAVLYIMELPEERVHFLEYGVLGFLLIRAAGARYRQLAFSLFIVLIASSVDELIQFMLPNRVGELRDVGMNVAGGMIGLWVGRVLYLP